MQPKAVPTPAVARAPVLQMVMTPEGPAMVQRGAQSSPPPGLVPLTPEEIAQLGLPEGGPTGARSGGFR
jgi:hypothetical protein